MARDIDPEDLSARVAALLERHRLGFLTSFSLAYLGFMFALAARKRFWYDELFTYYIATMPSVADIRHALEVPLDNHPLPFYLVTRAALYLPVNEHVAARLPGMVGVWLAAVLLFVLVARRTNALYGAVAMASLFLSFAAGYAYEARPYGLALGLTALALTAWLGAAEGRRRTLSLIGLALALASIISTSYYATLVMAPIAMAEIVRTRDRGRIDWPMWVAFGVGAATILLYVGGIARGLDRFSEVTWAAPYKMAVIDMYRRLFGDIVLVVVGLLILSPLYLVLRREQATERKSEAGRFPRHEIVAAVGFLLMPVLAYVAAVLVVHAVTARYVLSSVLGFGVLLAFALFRIARGSSLPAIAFLLVAACIFSAIGVAYEWHALGLQRAALEEPRALLAEQPVDLPIVISSPIPGWVLMHYERPETRARLYYVIPQPPVRSQAQLVAWRDRQTWLKLPRYFPVQAEELPIFLDRHRRFLFLETRSGGTRRIKPLLELGAALDLVAIGESFRLYLVDATAATGGAVAEEETTPRDRTRDSLR